ncbi:hypothetical protein [Roseomonas elaeocarpi]|uniref:DUF1674 domain-containing protein n=1 Tax=Roseomonas elaeocarpi TaxID=907779 RepID=A0ABV6JRY0_9PROT
MSNRPPEGPKAQHDAGDAPEGYIPRPPSPEAIRAVSEAQGDITDEWSGEPAEGGQGGPRRAGTPEGGSAGGSEAGTAGETADKDPAPR